MQPKKKFLPSPDKNCYPFIDKLLLKADKNLAISWKKLRKQNNSIRKKPWLRAFEDVISGGNEEDFKSIKKLLEIVENPELFLYVSENSKEKPFIYFKGKNGQKEFVSACKNKVLKKIDMILQKNRQAPKPIEEEIKEQAEEPLVQIQSDPFNLLQPVPQSKDQTKYMVKNYYWPKDLGPFNENTLMTMATLEEEQKENHLKEKDQIIQGLWVKIQELENENLRLYQKTKDQERENFMLKMGFFNDFNK